MAYHPHLVVHKDDPDCPGHDINRILAAKSREVGYCLCIHSFMSVIDFTGLGCDWCDQITPEHATSPELKEIRTEAVRAELLDGTGPCTIPSERNPAGRRWVDTVPAAWGGS